MRAHLAVLAFGAVALLLVAAGCGDNPIQVSVGTLRVAVTTTGGDLDRDGYRLFLDNVPAESVGVSAVAIVAGLPVGPHSVELRDVAGNCSVGGDNPRTVSVVAGQAVEVIFAATCVATGVRVRVTTTGIDLDGNGYAVVVDTGPQILIGISGAATISYLAAGPHSVTLNGVAANCSVAPTLPRTVDLAVGQIVAESLAVTCVATTGVLAITAATTGIDASPNGYTVTVDGGVPRLLPVNGLVTFPGLDPGDHSVTASGAATNCSVGGGNARTVTITAGGITRDTTRTTIAVTCVATTGVLEIAAVTTGIDVPASGFAVAVDNVTLPLPDSGTVRIPDLSPGDHSLMVSGAPANCAIGGSNPRTVAITAGGTTRDTTRTMVAVSCVTSTGVLAVTASTTGLDMDAGYVVFVDGGGVQLLAASSVLLLPGLSPGSHDVRLADVAGNCTVGGSNPRTVSVTAGGTTRDTTRTSFDVACVATTGAVEITVATTGPDSDANGYSGLVFNSSYAGSVTVPSSGSTMIPAVPVGDYLVGLGGVASNCAVAAPNPGNVTVAAGASTRDTARISFAVSCIGTTGMVGITTVTTGIDPDPDGYSVRVLGLDYNGAVSVGTNGAVTVAGVPAGNYVLSLGSEASNCIVTGGDSRLGTVTVGDTTTIPFDITCAASRDLAVTLHGDIYRVKENGTGLVSLTSSPAPEYDPAWSPDDARIAFVSERDGNKEIYVMNADGSGQMRLTNSAAADLHPSFSPDGSRIAYASNLGGTFDIWVMNADGSNPMRLTADGADDTDPAWSPDGLRIAFSSKRAGNPEIYVMTAGGSGQTRLTFDGGNRQPDWSPDGTKLAFAHLRYCDYEVCYYDPTTMYADGTGVARLPFDYAFGDITSAEDPVWGPDGRWIAFAATNIQCDYYSCYVVSRTINLVRTDGTSLTTTIVGNDASGPAWQR